MAQVHRDGDGRSCGASTAVSGNSSVFVNEKLASVQGDPNSHGGGELHASVNPGTVFVNNKPLVVTGSSASSDSLCPEPGGAHCNPTSTSGSPNVNAFGG
jgi:uncharacterized Zn-binding protein involved in type VI secretion